MAPAQLVAATLASLTHLLRHAPAEREAQEATIAHLVAMAGAEHPLELDAEPDVLAIDGQRVRIDAPGAMMLSELMLLHGIQRVEIAPPLDAERILALCSVLAAYPGTFGSFAEVEMAVGSGTDTGVLLTPAPRDLAIEHYAADPTLLPDPAAVRLSDTDEFIRHAEEGGLLHQSELEGLFQLEPFEPEGEAGDPTAPPPVEDQFSRQLGDALNRGRLAGQTENWEELLRAALEVVELEALAPTEALARSIRLELRRLLPRPHLQALARLASSGGRRQDAIAILRRLGADSTEVLMDLLVDEASMGTRRGLYAALTHMPDGHDVIIAHLRHPTWYVVRNAAELCGEMDLEAAVPNLAAQAGHDDERVRRSVAGALAKIGSPAALEALRALLADPSPSVRLRAVTALNPGRARGMATPLNRLLAEETEAEVIKGALLALARIGTPEALQALAAYAKPVRKRFGRGGRPAANRAWAAEALGQAGPAAEPLLRKLAGDDTQAVAAAARHALRGLVGEAPSAG